MFDLTTLATIAPATTKTMKALVYQGPGKKALETKPVPVIVAPTDAIVKITKTTICGTDLHILKGDVASCKPGRILGHEGVGVVESSRPGAWCRMRGGGVRRREAVGRPERNAA
jgi:D-arabinose 1-dehydrogenase-like Zn-dependent alcohol dehydrogenase